MKVFCTNREATPNGQRVNRAILRSQFTVKEKTVFNLAVVIVAGFHCNNVYDVFDVQYLKNLPNVVIPC